MTKDDQDNEGPPWPSMWDMDGALRGLAMLGDDPWLSMQAMNLAVVDQFIMSLERNALRAYFVEEKDVSSLMFLGAQTQLWLFGLYELLRTWRERATEAIKLHRSGGLANKIEHLRRDQGFLHVGAMSLADQLQRVLEEPSVIDKIRDDLSRAHVTFVRLDHLRVALAKHEVKGMRNSIAYAPGYARIDQQHGSLQYEIGTGNVILDVVTRRGIADEIRCFPNAPVPSQEALAAFDSFIKTKPGQDPFRSA